VDGNRKKIIAQAKALRNVGNKLNALLFDRYLNFLKLSTSCYGSIVVKRFYSSTRINESWDETNEALISEIGGKGAK